MMGSRDGIDEAGYGRRDTRLVRTHTKAHHWKNMNTPGAAGNNWLVVISGANAIFARRALISFGSVLLIIVFWFWRW